MVRMNMEELLSARLAVLTALLDETKTPKQELALRAGIKPNYLSRLINPGPASKAIGEEIALKIESGLDLEPGALLFPLSLRPSAEVRKPAEPWLFGEVTPKRLRDLPERRMRKIKRLVLAEVEEWEDEQREASAGNRTGT